MRWMKHHPGLAFGIAMSIPAAALLLYLWIARRDDFAGGVLATVIGAMVVALFRGIGAARELKAVKDACRRDSAEFLSAFDSFTWSVEQGRLTEATRDALEKATCGLSSRLKGIVQLISKLGVRDQLVVLRLAAVAEEMGQRFEIFSITDLHRWDRDDHGAAVADLAEDVLWHKADIEAARDWMGLARH